MIPTIFILFGLVIAAGASIPTQVPTSRPTAIPTPVPTGNNVLPIAYHQLVIVSPGTSELIRLRGYDVNVPNVSCLGLFYLLGYFICLHSSVMKCFRACCS